jgi:hypothetical protein
VSQNHLKVTTPAGSSVPLVPFLNVSARFSSLLFSNYSISKQVLWRQDNKPIELYTAEVTKQKLDYIHNNPVEAGIVDNPEEYVYSSARNYAGIIKRNFDLKQWIS